MGVVPIAFDSYASLREIITDGENGAVITEGNVNDYVSRLKELIRNAELFSQERIAEKWWRLLSGK